MLLNLSVHGHLLILIISCSFENEPFFDFSLLSLAKENNFWKKSCESVNFMVNGKYRFRMYQYMFISLHLSCPVVLRKLIFHFCRLRKKKKSAKENNFLRTSENYGNWDENSHYDCWLVCWDYKISLVVQNCQFNIQRNHFFNVNHFVMNFSPLSDDKGRKRICDDGWICNTSFLILSCSFCLFNDLQLTVIRWKFAEISRRLSHLFLFSRKFQERKRNIS